MAAVDEQATARRRKAKMREHLGGVDGAAKVIHYLADHHLLRSQTPISGEPLGGGDDDGLDGE